MMSRKIYDELIIKWPEKPIPWDLWMRINEQRHNRECIVPDISRTYHFGSKGFNILPLEDSIYFVNHSFYTGPDVTFNVQNMYAHNYDRILENLIEFDFKIIA